MRHGLLLGLIFMHVLLCCGLACCQTQVRKPAIVEVKNESAVSIVQGDTVKIVGSVDDSFVIGFRLYVDTVAVDAVRGEKEYSLTWSSTQGRSGLHTLVVDAIMPSRTKRVRKVLCRVTQSAPVRVSSPRQGAVVVSPTQFRLESDPGISVKGFELFINDLVVGKSDGGSESVTWSPVRVKPGQYTAFARATLDNGAICVSDSIQVTVPDRIAISSPSQNDQIDIDADHHKLKLKACVPDGVNIKSVQFVCDGKLCVGTPTSSGTEMEWDITNLVPGRHGIIGILTDIDKNEYTSKSVEIIVSNKTLEKRLAEEARKHAEKVFEEERRTAKEEAELAVERYKEQKMALIASALKFSRLSQAGGTSGRVNILAVRQLSDGRGRVLSEEGSMDIVDVSIVPGTGRISSSVPAGARFKEAFGTAQIYVERKMYSIGRPIDWSGYDVYLSFPTSDGTMIDGGSASVAMAVGMLSQLLNMPVRSEVAMTGVITSYGGVEPVGGVEFKAVAALSSPAILTLIVPDNMISAYALDQVPWSFIEGHRIIAASDMEQVLRQSIIGYDDGNLVAASEAAKIGLQKYNSGKLSEAVEQFSLARSYTPEDFSLHAWMMVIQADLGSSQ